MCGIFTRSHICEAHLEHRMYVGLVVLAGPFQLSVVRCDSLLCGTLCGTVSIPTRVGMRCRDSSQVIPRNFVTLWNLSDVCLVASRFVANPFKSNTTRHRSKRLGYLEYCLSVAFVAQDKALDSLTWPQSRPCSSPTLSTTQLPRY